MKGTSYMINFTSIKHFFYIFFPSILLIVSISCASTDKKETPKQDDIIQAEKQETEPQQPANNGQKVSDAVYTKTFSDIEALIAKLNKIISDSNFEEWKKYLTQNYINYYSSPDNLRTVSETPTLKKYKIVLRSLKDYFSYVVVPSRSDARLDSISFVDDNNIKAYMMFDGEPIILYNLVKIDGNWKIEK